MKTIEITDPNKLYRVPANEEAAPQDTKFSHFSLDIAGTKGVLHEGSVLPYPKPGVTSINLFPIFEASKYSITFADKEIAN